MRQIPNSNPLMQAAGAALIVGLLLGDPGYAEAPQNPWRELRATQACNIYQPMTASQLDQAEFLFKTMLNGKYSGTKQLANEWAKLGYELIEIAATGFSWIGLRDMESPCQGNGTYLFNANSPGQLVIQAPHAYQDLFTGDITAGLMREGIAMLAWNSTKRKTSTEHGAEEADLAKRSDSLFVALTRAMIKSYPNGRLIQIHGFDNRRRNTQAGASAAVIVSSGNRWPTRPVSFIAGCLNPVIAGPVLIFPSEITELGATRNIHGKTLRKNGHEGFVHIELSRPTRELLKSSPSLLAEFSECLGSGMSQ